MRAVMKAMGLHLAEGRNDGMTSSFVATKTNLYSLHEVLLIQEMEHKVSESVSL